MMKTILSCILISVSVISFAQERVIPSNFFLIEGKVKGTYKFSFDSSSKFNTVVVDSVVITNHLREKRRTLKNLKGILLKDILNKVEIDAPNVKLLSEYYITCIATDGYKAVFSWNEIFNTETGNHAMIIVEENGKKNMEMEGRIALLVPSDEATGRRFVKGLQKIIITRVQ
jgi:hypothetical protein